MSAMGTAAKAIAVKFGEALVAKLGEKVGEALGERMADKIKPPPKEKQE